MPLRKPEPSHRLSCVTLRVPRFVLDASLRWDGRDLEMHESGLRRIARYIVKGNVTRNASR